MTVTAVLLAGSRPAGDALAEKFAVPTKALVPLAGQAMILRPLAALLGSKDVAEVIVATQNPKRVGAVLPRRKRIKVQRSERSIAATLIAIANDPALSWPLLVTTADHALLDDATVAQFITAAKGADIAIGVVTKDALLQRLPDTKRTWLDFRGESVTGANLFYFDSARVIPAIGLWRSVEQDRKRGWRLLLLAGPLTVLGTILRLTTLDDVLRKVGRRLQLRLRAVRLTNPLAGVDVDKPADYDLVSAILNGDA